MMTTVAKHESMKFCVHRSEQEKAVFVSRNKKNKKYRRSMVHNKSRYKGNYVLYVKFGRFISERPPTDIRFLMVHHRV